MAELHSSFACCLVGMYLPGMLETLVSNFAEGLWSCTAECVSVGFGFQVALGVADMDSGFVL